MIARLKRRINLGLVVVFLVEIGVITWLYYGTQHNCDFYNFAYVNTAHCHICKKVQFVTV